MVKEAVTDKEATISVSVSRKINLGNYESVDVFVSLSGLKVDTTQDEIDALLNTGALAWDEIGAAIQEQVNKHQAPAVHRRHRE